MCRLLRRLNLVQGLRRRRKGSRRDVHHLPACLAFADMHGQHSAEPFCIDEYALSTFSIFPVRWCTTTTTLMPLQVPHLLRLSKLLAVAPTTAATAAEAGPGALPLCCLQCCCAFSNDDGRRCCSWRSPYFQQVAGRAAEWRQLRCVSKAAWLSTAAVGVSRLSC